MDAVFVVLLVLTGINAVCFTFFGNRKKIVNYITLKSCASGMLLLTSLYVVFKFDASPRLAAAFLTAITLCVAGDVLLALRYRSKKVLFTALGMSAFSLGQVGIYLTLVVTSSFLPQNILIAVLATALFFTLSIKPINNKYGKLIFNAAGYMLLIVLALVQSFSVFMANSAGIVAVLAASFFAVSDCLLSTMYFGGRDNSKTVDYLVHIFYFSAQLLYISFVYFYLF